MVEVLIEKAKIYLELPKGEVIHEPEELIYITSTKFKNLEYQVFFKNKTFKHFIERRNEELSKRHTKERVEFIVVAILHDLYIALNTYSNIYKNNKRKNSFVIYKDFEVSTKTPVTIILETNIDTGVAIIVSYHFTKR